MSLFDYVKENYSCYKECLGYYYQVDLEFHPEKLDEINRCDFVFVESDYAEPIEGCLATQFMTSAEHPDTRMWLSQDYSSYPQLPHSEWTDVPTVGFVGRVPVFNIKTTSPCFTAGLNTDLSLYRNLKNPVKCVRIFILGLHHREIRVGSGTTRSQILRRTDLCSRRICWQTSTRCVPGETLTGPSGFLRLLLGGGSQYMLSLAG